MSDFCMECGSYFEPYCNCTEKQLDKIQKIRSVIKYIDNDIVFKKSERSIDYQMRLKFIIKQVWSILYSDEENT